MKLTDILVGKKKASFQGSSAESIREDAKLGVYFDYRDRIPLAPELIESFMLWAEKNIPSAQLAELKEKAAQSGDGSISLEEAAIRSAPKEWVVNWAKGNTEVSGLLWDATASWIATTPRQPEARHSGPWPGGYILPPLSRYPAEMPAPPRSHVGLDVEATIREAMARAAKGVSGPVGTERRRPYKINNPSKGALKD